MAGTEAAAQPPPEELDAYLGLGTEDIARLVLCLLIEEALRRRLAVYRPQNPVAKPSRSVSTHSRGARSHQAIRGRTGNRQRTGA